MFVLDRTKNDTSSLLDLLRTLAAQLVCVGHAWNLTFPVAGITKPTLVPDIGVLLFFVLSGFVIAFTLHDRCRSLDYSLFKYLVERFARIYVAYFPALTLIALLDGAAFMTGVFDRLDSPASFARNLFMLQGYPGPWGGGTFGSAGQLSTLAIEFHIYLFVGGVFFFCLGRNRVSALILAGAAMAAPLHHFAEVQGWPHNLFVLWLLGFGGYFIAINMKIDRFTTVVCAVLSILLFWRWRGAHLRENEYGLVAYPYFAMWFITLSIAAQGQRWLLRFSGIIQAFAGYSFTLFLVHYTIEQIVVASILGPPWVAFGCSIAVSNVVAYFLARLTEARHKALAFWMIQKSEALYTGHWVSERKSLVPAASTTSSPSRSHQ